MFAAQTSFLTMICSAVLPSQGGGQPKTSRRHASGAGAPQGTADPRGRLIAVLAEMLPSTLDELAQAAELELPTAQAYLADMSARCVVMFNPLTKRYSLPKLAPGGALAA